jgi:hypothetical protein
MLLRTRGGSHPEKYTTPFSARGRVLAAFLDQRIGLESKLPRPHARERVTENDTLRLLSPSPQSRKLGR